MGHRGTRVGHGGGGDTRGGWKGHEWGWRGHEWGAEGHKWATGGTQDTRLGSKGTRAGCGGSHAWISHAPSSPPAVPLALNPRPPPASSMPPPPRKPPRALPQPFLPFPFPRPLPGPSPPRRRRRAGGGGASTGRSRGGAGPQPWGCRGRGCCGSGWFWGLWPCCCRVCGAGWPARGTSSSPLRSPSSSGTTRVRGDGGTAREAEPRTGPGKAGPIGHGCGVTAGVGCIMLAQGRNCLAGALLAAP